MGQIGISQITSPLAKARTAGPVAVVATGVLAFVLTATAISFTYREVTEPPYIEVMSEKLEDFAAHGDEYDLAFIGSSETFRHINPEIVDAELAACGLDIKTVNFGVPALQEPELRYLTQELLAHRPERLRYVVVQDPLRAEGVYDNMMTDRGRYFRGWDRLGDTARDTVCYTGTRAGLARRMLNNAFASMQETLGVGRLAQLSLPEVGQPAGLNTYDERYRENDGYWPVDEDPHVAWRGEDIPMTDEILTSARAHKGFRPGEQAATCRANQLLDTVAAFRAAGMDVAYYASPSPEDAVHDVAITDAVRAAAPDLPVFAYTDPTEHPEFMRKDLWFDRGHMKGEGADMLSHKLGSDMCAWIKGE